MEVDNVQPLDKAARIAGATYLFAILTGPFSLIYIPSVLFVRGNATATVANIATHEALFRLGIVADALDGVIFIFVTLALYRLLRGVDHGLAVLMVILGGIIPASIFCLNALNWGAALLIVHGAPFLAPFDHAQRDALAFLFIRIHSQGETLNQIFWGLWLLPFGTLVIRSGFIPRLLGIWLIVGGFGYLGLTFVDLALPQYQEIAFKFAQPALFSEVGITLWLLIRGAKAEPSSA
jgi:hypothetical protein